MKAPLYLFKRLFIAIGALASLSIVALSLCLHFYGPGAIVKEAQITSGNGGVFLIGETKESLLSRLPDQTYAPEPKLENCRGGWIKVKQISATEKRCLLAADIWEVGDGIESLCPERTDFFATLSFINNHVAKISVRCTRPE